MRKRMIFLNMLLVVLLLAATGYSDPWRENISKSETIDYINDYLHKSKVYGLAMYIPSADPEDERNYRHGYKLVDWDVEMDGSIFKLEARLEEQVERRNVIRSAYTLEMEFNPRYMRYAHLDKRNKRIVVITTSGERIKYVIKEYEGTLMDRNWDFEDRDEEMTHSCYIIMRRKDDARRLATALDYYADKWGSSKDPFDN